MESAKEDVLDHMNELWRTWRSRMNRDHVKPHDSLEEILDDVPEFLSKEDWEWCVKEKFLSEEFLKMSKNNAKNRAMKTMNHHSGSRLVRQISLNLKKKLGRAPTVAELVFDTYKEGDTIKDKAANARHTKMVETIEANPNFTALEVVEASIGEQKRGHVVCFGGGLKPRDLKVTTSTMNAKEASLEEQLRRSDEAKEALQETVSDLQGTVSEQAGELTSLKDEVQKLKQMFENSQTRHN